MPTLFPPSPLAIVISTSDSEDLFLPSFAQGTVLMPENPAAFTPLCKISLYHSKAYGSRTLDPHSHLECP